MDLRSEQLREALAAEYVLGTLHGRARRHFERRLQRDPALRQAVAQWQVRLTPLNQIAEPVAPPTHVWRAIERRIAGESARGFLARLWDSTPFWRSAAFTAAVATVALAAYLSLLLPAPAPRDLMVVVMTDDKSSPGMTISWDRTARSERRLRVRIIGHQEMAPDTAWELWMLPGAGQQPVSLGLINTNEMQVLALPRNLLPAIDAAWGLAMSVEPRGGSPTGLPTGPVLYKGQCTRL